MSSTCPHNMVNFGPLTAEISSTIWGTPTNFSWFRVLGALLHSTNSGRRLNFVALNRGNHLCSAGRPSRWALAHVLVLMYFSQVFMGSEPQKSPTTKFLWGSGHTLDWHLLDQESTRWSGWLWSMLGVPFSALTGGGIRFQFGGINLTRIIFFELNLYPKNDIMGTPLQKRLISLACSKIHTCWRVLINIT